jgi:6-phosphogluconate dehydrogenase
MKVGMIGLGRMGEGMSRRLIAHGHEVWGYRNNYAKAQEQYESGYISGCTTSIESLVQVMHSYKAVSDQKPAVFMMVVPADLAKLGIAYIDCGTSGGVYGLDRGYCLMVGGGDTAVATCAPIFNALAPGVDAAPRTKSDAWLSPAERGWLRCGGPGAGHFVKMVHNGIEYGIMQSYAEGFNILANADLGSRYTKEKDAEVAPMSDPENYQYDINVAEVAELWRRGSVVGSWLLDLTASVLLHDRELSKFDGGVSDSGEGRWTVHAAVDLGVPAPVLSTALYERFNSRRLGTFASKVLNGMRYMFGGHHVR